MPRKKQKGKAAAAAAASPRRNNSTVNDGPRSPKKNKAAVSTTKGFTLDRINDILDFETEHIMMNRENRQEHLDTFEYFWDLHPAKLVKSGRRYARFLMAQILVIASGQKPYISMVRAKNRNHDDDDHDDDDTDNEEEEGDDETENILCLDQWSREHWDKLHYLLTQLRQVLLRDDATINYSSKNDTLGFPGMSAAAAASRKPPTNPYDMDSSSDEADSQKEDEEVDHCKLVAMAPGLGKKFRMLLQFIEINKAIAPIREELERQIREPIKISDSDMDDDDNNNNNDVVVVKTKELLEVFENADKIKDEMVQGAVLRIFHPSAQEDAEDSKTPSLRTRKQLIKILQTAHNAYNLVDFQDRLDRILLKFAKQVFGNDDIPTLVKLGYTMPAEEDVVDGIVDVDDGNEEDDFILAAARGHGSKKKKTAPRPSSSSAGRGRSRDGNSDSGHKRRRRIPKELKELKRGRDALNNNHGDDPRDESLRIMEQAKRAAALRNKRRHSSRGGRHAEDDDDENNYPEDHADDDSDDDSGLKQQQRKSPARSATKKRQGTKRKERGHILDRSSSDESDTIEDDDDDDDAELEKEYAAVTLSIVPEKKKARVVAATQSKNYGLPAPDPGIFDDMGNVMKRTRWSDDEKTAIKQGVTKHGVGKWVEIKQEYGRVLHNRTTVQIKDKWRNMVKNKEVE